MRINGFRFASNAPNFIGFGVNLGLVDFFKVIQCPRFCWVGTKSHDTLGDMTERKTTLVMIIAVDFKERPMFFLNAQKILDG